MKILFIIIICMLFIPNINASYIIMDSDNSRVIEGSDVSTKRHVASISKIMTAIIAIESGMLDDIVKVGDEVKSSYGSGIYIKENEQLKLIDLVYGLMLRSGNDAALAIAKYVAGDIESFVKLMNEKAKELKMYNTVFNNPHGLEVNGGNISTPYDMALLSSYAINNETYREITQTKNYKLKTNLNYYDWTNKNKLLSMYKYAIGGKTGYTEIAKRTLVTNARKNNMEFTIVTLNEPNDFELHKNLYTETFELYKNYKILKKGKIKIIGYDISNGYLYINNNYNVTLNEIERENLILKFKINDKYIESNNKVGVIEVILYDKVIYSEDIYIKITKDTFIKKIRKWLFDK